uniref:NADH dehydrogenase subunit 1 n=1 Tax=Synelmis amoureuxi TaxID=3053537 RepID=UPI0030E4F32F
MLLSFTSTTILTFLCILLAMAFFTLLERKAIGYIQIRKGPNKVGIMGLPQPFADALKLFCKEQSKPTLSNLIPFILAPMISLVLALLMWLLYPMYASSMILNFSILAFLCISSVNVYTTLSAGWFSNSKYALLGALRSVAQTISYEVSMSIILLTALVITTSYSLFFMSNFQWSPILLCLFPLFMVWFTTMLAETNRTPFDFAEGESELVSGFNTEYSAGTFALIFMAEYTSIMAMSMISSSVFISTAPTIPILTDLILVTSTLLLSFSFIWIRGTLPRMRYDRLMNLTWKSFLPFALVALLIFTPLVTIIQ